MNHANASETTFVLTDNPDLTIKITPNQQTWCAKGTSWVDETPAVVFTSGRGVQACLDCYEKVHGPLSREAHNEINSMTITANIKYYAEKLLYWKGKQKQGR